MWHKSKNRILMLLVGLAFTGITGLQAQKLYIGEHEGPPTAYFLSDIQTLRFTASHISVLKIDGVLETYAITDVRTLNFRLVPTAIREAIRETNPAASPGTLHIFPNPVTDILNIHLPSPLKSNGRLDIISPEGKLISTTTIKGSDKDYQINVSRLAKGFYLLRMHSGSVVETARFIIQ